ncbi:hypothetical protein L9S41_17080 [Geoalkalibacter halelectricus]|uniref:PEP-CTERM protein-sorting domain-containing protein n=1 Tax=Geoalkalibacter halelectricus TaxID=2847045 RepID=A0ABY5ZKK4_9BACT|nr:hypothetical protein [Geoalkalibacter halelectricus]UWZ79374.1 hypothetical protein L9S41_17080 [Geoalkalibacter halelectricus]
MAYLVILPLIAGVIFALVIYLRRGTRPTSKRDLVKLGVISGGFVALALAAAIHLALNGALG